MRNSAVIIDEINRLKEIIKEAEILEKKGYDNNILLHIAFEQDKERYKYLLGELEQALKHENKHILKFIIKNAKKGVPIVCERFMYSVLAFQKLIQEIGKELFDINKDDLNLAFNDTFKGSFGVLLTTEKKDMELISKSYLTLVNIFETLQSLNDDTILNQFIKKNLQNFAILKRYRAFYQTQSKYNNDLHIIWGDTQDKDISVYITKERLVFIANALTSYEQLPDKIIHDVFTIKGISLVKKRIELETPENKILEIPCNDEKLLIDGGQNINRKKTFVIKMTQKTNILTDMLDVSYAVVSMT